MKNKRKIIGLLCRMLIVSALPLMSASPAFTAEPTTSVTITKYANDGTTILDQTTVDYLWMMENCRSMATGQLIITTTAYF